VERGGNGIQVLFDGKRVNLHHVWDTSIAEKFVGGVRRRRGGPFEEAKKWADELTREIEGGKFAGDRIGWLRETNLSDVKATAMAWARECNAYVCTTGEYCLFVCLFVHWLRGSSANSLFLSLSVLPEGPEAIRGQELGSEYYEAAAPVIELQVARAGYRLAAWLDSIVSALKTEAESSLGDL
jgi:hypothetical protein